MYKKIKRLVQGVLLTSVWFLPAFTIYAGGINAEEQRVLDVANGEFTYEDKIYIATEGIKERLEIYLSQDDIDLTKADADRAIEKGFGSVYDGIESGYLILAPGQEEPKKKPGSPDDGGQGVNKPDISAEDIENMDFDELMDYVDEYQVRLEKQRNELSEVSEEKSNKADDIKVVGQVANAGNAQTEKIEIEAFKLDNSDIAPVVSPVKEEHFSDNGNFLWIVSLIIGIVIAGGAAVVIIHRTRPANGRNRDN